MTSIRILTRNNQDQESWSGSRRELVWGLHSQQRQGQTLSRKSKRNRDKGNDKHSKENQGEIRQRQRQTMWRKLRRNRSLFLPLRNWPGALAWCRPYFAKYTIPPPSPQELNMKWLWYFMVMPLKIANGEILMTEIWDEFWSKQGDIWILGRAQNARFLLSLVRIIPSSNSFFSAQEVKGEGVC